MRAVRLHPPGRIEDLQLDEIQPPEPRGGQVLVRVHAAGITRDELEWPADRLPAIPSYELSGVVARDTDDFAFGTEVFALTPFDRDGVAADYAAVPVEVLAAKPPSLSHVQAAALPMGGLSAWQALVVHGRLQPGERVAVTGAHGGVGHLAVQLARSHGATLVDAGEPCDLLFDSAGGEALARSAKRAGRVVTIAAEAPGATYFVVEPNREQLLELARLVDTGELQPEIDSTFPLAEVQAAFMRSAARGKHGKVIPALPRPRSRDATLAGVLLSLAGVVILLGFITAEALYPGLYTTHTNTVSHLAASEPPASVVLQPSAAIFNLTMVVTGAMILAGAWFAARALGRRAVLVPTALLGLGCVGVGVFPLTHPGPHTLFALIAFLAGGVALIVSSRVTAAPFRQLWALLGVVALAATAMGVLFLEWAPVAALGEGGIERWIIYPIVLWLVAFGSYLLAVAACQRAG